MKKYNINQKEKWNKRAHSYPSFSEETSGVEERVISLAESAGVAIRDKTLLDIGCGTGRFTIRISKKASQVTAVDISENMLNILEEDARAEGLTNIKTLCADWKDTSPAKCEIVMATLTPALRTEHDFQRMLDTAEEHVIYLGWVQRKECPMIRDIYKTHNVDPTGFDFPGKFSDLLEKRTYDVQFFPVKDEWERTGSITEMTERLAQSIKEYGGEPDLNSIRQKLLENSTDGINITYITDVELKLAIISKTVH
ncbi:MAG: hypothetical protein C0602_03455 [Denitrovibrio sp.]|nr:MAG: hypothetical protein C0602_03455 [Denitrovibrio sp.]